MKPQPLATLALLLTALTQAVGQDGILPRRLVTAASGAQQADEQPANPQSTTPTPSEPTPEVPPAVSEQKLTGYLEAGFRWLPEQSGSLAAYRTVVNLGEGPRLFGAELNWNDPGNRIADRASFRASNWGGDPYNTSRLELSRRNLYDFHLNYRNLAQFNALPSFANPLLERGIFVGQRSLDLRRRQLDSEFTFTPNSWLSPYAGYDYSSTDGRGINTFVADGNEFPVASGFDDRLHSARGGARVGFAGFHLILEQGWTRYRDESRLNFTGGGNTGNRSTPLFGQTLRLDQFTQPWEAQAEGRFNRAILTAGLGRWATISGQLLYSRPRLDVTQNLNATGNFVLLSELLPFNQFSEMVTAEARMPRTSGSLSVEYRLLPRLRIIQSWMTDRLDIDTSGSRTQEVRTATTATTGILLPGFSDSLAVDYSQHQIDILFDATRSLSVRAGHRYVWADALVRQPTLTFPQSVTGAADLRRHVALVGVRYRFGSRITANIDLEASPTREVYFRTSLAEYQKARTRVSWQILPSLTVTSLYSVLNNEDSQPGIQFDMQSQEAGGSVSWSPGSGRRFSVLADYSYTGMRTRIPALLPPFYDRTVLRFTDHGHHGGLYADLGFTSLFRLNFGGSFSTSGGSRPVDFYQPQVKITAPLAPKVAFAGEWRWYGFTEPTFAYENFRTHLLSAGFRIALD